MSHFVAQINNGKTVKKQDFLGSIDLKSKEDFAKYNQRQVIVEHLFGTIKRGWDAAYFLTRGTESVTDEWGLFTLGSAGKKAAQLFIQ